MDCSQAQDFITRSLSGNASAADEATLRSHLQDCGECSHIHARLRQVWTLTGRLRPVALSREKSAAVSARVKGSAPLRAGTRRALWAAGGAAAALMVALLFASLRPATTPPVATTPEPAEKVERDTVQSPEAVRAEALLVSIDEEKRRGPAQAASTPKAPAPETPAIGPLQPDTPAPAPAAQAPAVALENKPPVIGTPQTIPTPLPPSPLPKQTASFVATLERFEGVALIVTQDGRTPARAGVMLQAGQGLRTEGEGSQAVVEFEDGSRLVLGADSSITQFAVRGAGKSGGAKQVELASGVLAAQVSRQAAGEPFIITTPQAEARVLGTRLTLSVLSNSTLLEVAEGRVRLSRKDDNAHVDVGAGQYAVAGARGTPLAARASAQKKVGLAETFDRGRWGQAWALQSESGASPRPAVLNGQLCFRFPKQAPAEVTPSGLGAGEGKLSPEAQKAFDSVIQGGGIGSRSEWPRASWLEARQPFPLGPEAPLRIQVRLWQSHADPDRAAWICLNRKPGAQVLALERRGNALQLWSGGAKESLCKIERPLAQDSEMLEIWLTPDVVVVRRDGVTLHVGPNPSKSRTFQLAVGGGAKATIAQEEEVRFDAIEVAWMTQADLAKIVK